MQSRARGGDDLRTTTIDALYNDVDYTDPRDEDASSEPVDRKSGVEGKSVDLGGRRHS